MSVFMKSVWCVTTLPRNALVRSQSIETMASPGYIGGEASSEGVMRRSIGIWSQLRLESQQYIRGSSFGPILHSRRVDDRCLHVVLGRAGFSIEKAKCRSQDCVLSKVCLQTAATSD